MMVMKNGSQRKKGGTRVVSGFLCAMVMMGVLIPVCIFAIVAVAQSSNHSNGASCSDPNCDKCNGQGMTLSTVSHNIQSCTSADCKVPDCACRCHTQGNKATDDPFDAFLVQPDEHAGTTVHLFDYWLTEDRFARDDQAFAAREEDHRYIGSETDLRESGINRYQVFEFVKNPPKDNGSPNPGGVRSMNAWAGDDRPPKTDLVTDLLSNEGYPVIDPDKRQFYITSARYLGGKPYLNAFNLQSGVLPEADLGYLFNPNPNANTANNEYRAVFPNVTGLFQLNEGGYYYYNSQENYASYDTASNSFKLYNEKGVEAGGTSPDGQFFPFNTAEQVFDISGNQLALKAGLKSTDKIMNHYFGLSMQTRFIQPTGGVVEAGNDMIYTFSGDDDVWVYIDGVLVADLGGIHDAASLSINFKTGMVNTWVTKTETQFGRERSLKTIFNSALGTKFNSSVFDGDTFADGTIHTLSFFYMERGNTDSNMSLMFNLETVPYSAIVKNNQDGTPISGAMFELYPYYPGASGAEGTTGNLICRVTTEADGKVTLTDENNQILSFGNAVAHYNTEHFLLREAETPTGYRPLNEDIIFRYENGILIPENTFETGAYTSAVLHVEMLPDNALLPGVAGQTIGTTTIVMDTPLVDQGINFTNGILFGVQTKFNDDDTATIPEGLDYNALPFFDESNFHPMYGSLGDGWKVMAESILDKAAVVKAAKELNYVANRNFRGRFTFEFRDLAGALTERNAFVLAEATELYPDGTEDFFNKRMEYMNKNCKFLMAYYYAPGISSLDQLTENTEIIRIHSANHSREYSTDFHIPNIYDQFAVQKLDYYGKRIEGAEFTLIQAFTCNENHPSYYKPLKDTSDGSAVVDSMGHPLYYNPHVLVGGVGSYNGQNPVYEIKNYDQLVLSIKNGDITPWDKVVTHNEDENRENLGLQGFGFFPSKRGGAVVESDTSTYLEPGHYLLIESATPNGYSINKVVTNVQIDVNGIIIDAGAANNGVRVGKAVGHPLQSMMYYCAEDPIDVTLSYVDGVLEQGQVMVAGEDDTVIYDPKPPAEGVAKFLYKYNAANRYYYRYAMDVMDYVKWGRNLFLYSDVGYIHMKITQNQDGTPYTLAVHGDHTDHEDVITITIQQGDDVSTRTDWEIPAHHGMLTFRLKEGEKIVRVYSEYHQSELTQIEQGGTILDNQYTLFKPNVTHLDPNMDLSHLFVTSTIVQVQNRNIGALEVNKEVEIPTAEVKANNSTKPEPFYFRVDGWFDNVTKVVLRNADGTKSNYTGLLNVRVYEYDPESTELPSLQASGTCAPKYFENGECSFFLPEGFFVDYVYIPLNSEHEAYGTHAVIPIRIDLGDKFTGKLSVTTTNINNPKDVIVINNVEFKEGTGYIERAPAHSAISIEGYENISEDPDLPLEGKKLRITSRYQLASTEEIYGSNITDRLQVTFTDPDNLGIITGGETSVIGSSAGRGYYIAPFAYPVNYEGKQFNLRSAVFALYPGQTINIPTLGGGIKYRVTELGVGGTDKPAKDELTAIWTTTGLVVAAPTTTDRDYFVGEERAGYGAIRTGQTQRVEFVNKRVDSGLTIEKTVTGNMGDRTKYFAIDLFISNPYGSHETPTYKVTGGSKLTDGVNNAPEAIVTAGKTNTLWIKHGEVLSVLKLPYGTTYTVKEHDYAADGYDKPKYEGSDIADVNSVGAIDSYNEWVKITNNKEALIATGVFADIMPYVILLVLSGVGIGAFAIKNRKKRAGTLAVVVLALLALSVPNASFAKPDEVQVSLPVTIKLEGAIPAEDEDYHIALVPDDTSYPMPTGSYNGRYLLTITGEGTELMREISYNECGVYTYTLSQIAGDNEYCEYDDIEYLLTVHILNDENGNLTSAVTLRPEPNADKSDSALFVNNYIAPPSSDDDSGSDSDTPVTGTRSSVACALSIAVCGVMIIVMLRKNKPDTLNECE